MRGTSVMVVVLALGSVLACNAFACGESMFRVGKGVHYRAYTAPIPGNVLVYARTPEERAVAEQLQQAGHQVLLVDSDTDLAIQLNHQPFDVIIAPASERLAVENAASNLGAPPEWIPVYGPASEENRQVKADYRGGVNDDDDIRKYLKAIHKNLKANAND